MLTFLCSGSTGRADSAVFGVLAAKLKLTKLYELIFAYLELFSGFHLSFVEMSQLNWSFCAVSV